MLVNWVTEIRKQCHDAGVAFFFKQWGGVQKKRNGRDWKVKHGMKCQ
jgi:protein gp37